LIVLIDAETGVLGRLFSEARPIDWLIVIIDICVLLWIAVADLVKIPHGWKKRRAMKRIAAFLAEGENLACARPAAQASAEEAAAWVESVKRWIVDIHSYLAEEAIRALAVFGQRTAGPPTEIKVHPLAEDWILELDARMGALRSIMEKAEAYF